MSWTRRWRAAALLAAAACFAGAGGGLRGCAAAAVKTRIVLVDVSASVVRSPAIRVEDLAAAGCAGLTPRDRVAVVLFAGRAKLAVPPRAFGSGLEASRDALAAGDDLEPLATDFGAALDLARGLLAGVKGEVVLVSDGLATAGREALGASQDLDTALVLAASPPANRALRLLRAPRRAAPGARVLAAAVVASRGPGPIPAAVRFTASSGDAVDAPLTPLPSGDFAAEAPFVMPARGSLDLEARIDGRDPFPEDDRIAASVAPTGLTRVGLLGSAPAWSAALRAAPAIELVPLEKDGRRGAPIDVLAVAGGEDVSRQALDAAASWAESGGGLLYVGSAPAYAAGFLEGSRLTDWLPLLPASDPDGDDLLILLDASGSMAGVKLESARRAVRAVATLAGSKARARAAVFRKALEPPVALRGGALEDWLRGVEARGSTDVLAALSGAAAAFEGGAGRRRVFLVSDGLDKGGGGIAAEARRRGEELRQARVQLTAFAVGADADREFLGALTLDGAIGQVLDVRDAESLPPALTEAFGRGSLAPGGPVSSLRPPGAPLTFAGLPPIGAVVKTRAADGAFLLAATAAGDPVFAWHRAARVVAFAGLPGSAEAPAYVNPGDLWRDVLTALAGSRLEASAVLGGGRVSVEGLPGDAAAVVLTQGGARAVAYRADGRTLEGDAAGLRPGPAALSSLTGEALGPVFVEAPVPDEASPHATPVRSRGLEELRGSAESAAPSSALALAGLVALVAAVFLPRRPSS